MGKQRRLEKMTCKCGFKFAGSGEFRNCAAFITKEGSGGVICPTCKTAYVDGVEVTLAQSTLGVKES